MKKILYSLIVLLTMVACSSADEPLMKDGDATTSKYLTSQEAVAVAQKALVQFGLATPSRSYRTANVELFYNPHSRSTATDTTFYIVNFTDGGFALVAADKTASVPVFGFSGEGSFEYSEENGTSDYINAVIDGLLTLNPGGGVGKPGTLPLKPADQNCPGLRVEDENGSYCKLYKRIEIDTLNLTLPTNWGQGYPYNSGLPKCGHCNSTYWVGCAPLAIGQLCAKYRKYLVVDGVYMNWNNILEHPTLNANSSSECISMVGTLLRKIGETCSSAYGCPIVSGTGTSQDKALQGLRSYGFQYAEYTYNFMDAVNQMQSNGPTYMRADVRNETSGHAWVTDGYLKEDKIYEIHYSNHLPMSEEVETSYYFHMNWGWDGSSNGYYYIGSDVSPNMTNLTLTNFRFVKKLR